MTIGVLAVALARLMDLARKNILVRANGFNLKLGARHFAFTKLKRIEVGAQQTRGIDYLNIVKDNAHLFVIVPFFGNSELHLNSNRLAWQNNAFAIVCNQQATLLATAKAIRVIRCRASALVVTAGIRIGEAYMLGFAYLVTRFHIVEREISGRNHQVTVVAYIYLERAFLARKRKRLLAGKRHRVERLGKGDAHS